MSYNCDFPEEQRQIILLALHKLKLERPGWTFAIGEIEEQLGGQLKWPEYVPVYLTPDGEPVVEPWRIPVC